MQLSDKNIQKFIESWKKDFGEVLTPEQALVEARRLLDFFQKFAEGLTRIRQHAKESSVPPTVT